MAQGKQVVRYFVGLLMCLVTVQVAWAISGPQVTQLLNAQYRQTSSVCVGDTTVYHCSGVLARRSPAVPTATFWTLAPEADAAGVRFDYWRTDRAPMPAERLNGFVLTSVFTAIGVGKQLDVVPDVSDSEALVTNWDDALPARMPVQALFYDVGTAGALRRAQKDQLDFFQATGEWLPVLRLQRDDAQQSLFGFSQNDQLYVGYQVAARLNARYADTSPVCRDGRAAFYCNGVLIRTTDQSTAFHSWNPSPGSVKGNGVSFSYLRADTYVTKLYQAQGFVIREQSAPAGNPLSLRCSYPFDGHSATGSSDTCRVHGGLCSEVGVTSVATWVARYAANPYSSCAFNTDPQQFQLSIEVRLHSNDRLGWNEPVLAAWPQNNPNQLPIEAFIYTTLSHHGTNGLAGAQNDQKDYFQVTGRYIPIMRVTLNAIPGQVFVFNPQEQGVQ